MIKTKQNKQKTIVNHYGSLALNSPSLFHIFTEPEQLNKRKG